MTVKKRGSSWTGTEAGDLDEYLHAFDAGGYRVGEVVHAACAAGGHGDAGFAVMLDDEEGVAVRRCLGCQAEEPMLDSAEFLDDAELGAAACPCGHEEFDSLLGSRFGKTRAKCAG